MKEPKYVEEFELPDGNIFSVTEELLKSNTDLGKILRDYTEKKNIANTDEEKAAAIRDLFMTIFDGINTNPNMWIEFSKSITSKNKC